tara:strand:- start:137 stop:514 length:378 start_codon:yes stop_codon:yes gene_type:complete
MNEAQVVICFDYGTKKIGACVGETVTGSSNLLNVIPNDRFLTDTLNRIFTEWRPDLCIIGEPENPTEDFNLRKKSFVKSIEKDFNLPVLNSDETLSSQSVPKNITKDLIDSYSAKIIFDGWFNNK